MTAALLVESDEREDAGLLSRGDALLCTLEELAEDALAVCVPLRHPQGTRQGRTP
jgi:hypothetical protein